MWIKSKYAKANKAICLVPHLIRHGLVLKGKRRTYGKCQLYAIRELGCSFGVNKGIDIVSREVCYGLV